MGQKVNPIGLRLGVNKTWKSKWYVDPREYAETLHEDLKLRKALVECPEVQGAEISDVEIIRKPQRITTVIQSILAHSDGDVAMGAEEEEAFLALKDFMYANVYNDRTAKREEQKVEKVLTELYEYYLTHIDQMSNFYLQLAYQEGRDRAVTDYISGMSDEFAIRTFEDVFVPRKWHVL